MNDFIQLSPQSNIHEAETMVEGQHYLTFCASFPVMLAMFLSLM